MGEISEILKDVQLVSIDRDEFAKVMGYRAESKLGTRCPYRYDVDSGLLYIDKTEKNARYTYIAKSNCVNVYKVGRTSDLSKRAISLTTKKPYSFLDLKVIAFSSEDHELYIKAFSNSMYNNLPGPFKTAEELLFLSDEDIDFIVSTCNFKKTNGEKLPGKLERTTRTFYDAYTGDCLYSKTIANFE